jgi:TatD DNase family protein
VELFDSHLHLDDQAFDADREDVVARARTVGIIGMVTIGTNLDSCRAAIALAEKYSDVFAAVAIHPHEADQATDEVMEELGGLAGHAKVVAIGETGLDFVRERAPREAQLEALRRHVRLSRDTSLPLIIHCREAYPDILKILGEEHPAAVIMHAFSSSAEVARECAARGYLVALGGPVTYKNALAVADVARTVPREALLVETDAPVLPPEPHRGRRNEPAYLRLVVERIAQLRGEPADAVADSTTENARRVYGIEGR